MSFAHISRLWNLLSQEVIEAKNITEFEIELGKHVAIMNVSKSVLLIMVILEQY